MYATDGDSTPSESGYITPPLSPTKTISTEGWSSPRTPGSPRKSRSCLFFRDIGNELENPFFSPRPSPTKPKFERHLGALSIPEVFSPIRRPASPSWTNDSPVKRNVPVVDLPSPRRSLNVARSTSRSLPPTINPAEAVAPTTVPSPDYAKAHKALQTRNKRRVTHRCSSDSSIEALVAKYATSPILATNSSSDIEHDTCPTDHKVKPPSKLGRLPLRSSSSPLRPSQWASRGGLLSPPRKSQTSTPDRFIHCRRPPAVTRESYELSKPIERERISQRGHRAGGDPFSRRVRRSDRLNAELRGLREAHTFISGRPGGNTRTPNLRLRSGSLMTSARQISAGAVWNVGGPSAVSDTVTAVSTGTGGMLGSGTTAPLYTSTFLNRADPEAELEAYERRLALALEVDQTDRILQHSPAPTGHSGARHEKRPPHAPHFWRNSAWAQDDIRPRSFCRLSKFLKAQAKKKSQAPRRPRQKTRRPVPILPFRYVTSAQVTCNYVDLSLQFSTHPN